MPRGTSSLARTSGWQPATSLPFSLLHSLTPWRQRLNTLQLMCLVVMCSLETEVMGWAGVMTMQAERAAALWRRDSLRHVKPVALLPPPPFQVSHTNKLPDVRHLPRPEWRLSTAQSPKLTGVFTSCTHTTTEMPSAALKIENNPIRHRAVRCAAALLRGRSVPPAAKRTEQM